MAAKMAIFAITTSNSIKVNAVRALGKIDWDIQKPREFGGSRGVDNDSYAEFLLKFDGADVQRIISKIPAKSENLARF